MRGKRRESGWSGAWERFSRVKQRANQLSERLRHFRGAASACMSLLHCFLRSGTTPAAEAQQHCTAARTGCNPVAGDQGTGRERALPCPLRASGPQSGTALGRARADHTHALAGRRPFNPRERVQARADPALQHLQSAPMSAFGAWLAALSFIALRVGRRTSNLQPKPAICAKCACMTLFAVRPDV